MILALSTLGPETRLWLLSADVSSAKAAETVLAQEKWLSERSLADGLLSHIHALLTSQNGDWASLTGLVIASGPGSFTSLRIGHTVANSLASSLNIPIAGAIGEDWMGAAIKRLPLCSAGEPVWPEYGGEANITRPRA